MGIFLGALACVIILITITVVTIIGIKKTNKIK